jgi:hypothetical protein
MMNRTLNRTLRGRATCALLAAVAAGTLGLAVATAGPASAATFPGPPAMPGGTVLPAPGHLGNPANIYAGSTSSGQVIEDAFDSSAWGSQARTFGANGSNAQRVHFAAVDTRNMIWDGPTGITYSQDVSLYQIMHYTADGAVLCLDADGSAGAPGAGATVTWYGCDPNSLNQPNQLWAYVHVAHRPNSTPYTPEALVNVGSLQYQQTLDVRDAPILAASDNAQGTNAALRLVTQSNATTANSAWKLTDAPSS